MARKASTSGRLTLTPMPIMALVEKPDFWDLEMARRWELWWGEEAAGTRVTWGTRLTEADLPGAWPPSVRVVTTADGFAVAPCALNRVFDQFKVVWQRFQYVLVRPSTFQYVQGRPSTFKDV
jgi:hypothetical protein